MKNAFKMPALLLAMALTGLSAPAQDLIPEQNEKGKWGYVDQNHRVVIDYKYDLAGQFEEGIARVRVDGEFRLINTTGKEVSGKYTVMQPYADTDNYLVSTGGALMEENEEISTRRSVNIERFGGTMVLPIKNAKWGIIDRTGREIVKPIFQEISDPRDGVIYIIGDGGKWGLLNDLYGGVLKPTYTFMGSFNNLGVCWVCSGGKLDPIYVEKGKMSIIDKTGKLLIPLQFEALGTFKDSDSDRYSSQPAKELSLRPFDPLPDSDEDVLWYETKGTKSFKPGLINSAGKILMPEGRYHTVYKPTEGMAMVEDYSGKTTCFFDIENKKEVQGEPGFFYSFFKDGSSVASKNDGSVNFLVDRNLKEISERYTNSGDKSGDYLVVARGGKCGVIDRKGRSVINLQYSDAAEAVSDGTLIVRKADLWGVVDMNNNIKIPFEYSKLIPHEEGYYGAVQNGKIGILSFDNQIILPIEWTEYRIPEKYPPEYVWVSKPNGIYYFDIATQKVVFPDESIPGYDYAESFRDRKFARVGYETKGLYDPSAGGISKKILYGAVRKDGVVVVPINHLKLDEVDRALFYLEKNGLDEFREVDQKRFQIQLRGTCNSHSITSPIPQDDWDY